MHFHKTVTFVLGGDSSAHSWIILRYRGVCGREITPPQVYLSVVSPVTTTFGMLPVDPRAKSRLRACLVTGPSHWLAQHLKRTLIGSIICEWNYALSSVDEGEVAEMDFDKSQDYCQSLHIY